jgi:hypothetical protein
MNAWNVPQVTRTTLTALAGILVAINLKYKWLPLTEHDTAMVAGILGFVSQIFQRQGMKKAEVAATAAYTAALAATPPATPGWGEAAASGWGNSAAPTGWGAPEAPVPAWTSSDQGGMPMQAILQRLEALEQK